MRPEPYVDCMSRDEGVSSLCSAQIIIVDDRTTNRAILKQLASGLAEKVCVSDFADPHDALVQARRQTPDLVITDFNMPAMNGAEFVRRFRTVPDCAETPVIVVTAYEDRNFRYAALESGATDFLLSPIDHREFLVRARNLLKLRRQQQIIEARAHSLAQELATTSLEHELAMRESAERLRAVIDAVPAMISAADADGRLVFVNSCLAEAAGIRPEQAEGKTLAQLFGRRYASGGGALDRQVFATGLTLPPFEEGMVDVSGEELTLLTVKSPLRDRNQRVSNTVTASIDITARKRAERLVTRQSKFLRTVIDSNPNLIFTVARNGCITLANRALGEACGRPAEDLIDRPAACALFREPAEAEQFARDLDGTFGGADPADMVRRFTDAAGQVRWLQSRMMLIERDDAPEALCVATDITERMALERHLRQAKDEAEAANRAKSAFLANMSHELRTPLNAIIGFAQVIMAEMFGPVGSARYLEYARDIGDSGQHLLAIINDVLDLARIEAGQSVLHEAEIAVADSVSRAAALMRQAAEAGRVSIELALPDDLPPIRADRAKLMQILFNLLSNAVKFTPAGGTVKIMAERDSGNAVRITVADTGIGMSPEEIPVAMTRFGQIGDPVNRKHQGTGLGLSLAVHLVELHGGTLTIESTKGKGTAVHVAFPPERTLAALA